MMGWAPKINFGVLMAQAWVRQQAWATPTCESEHCACFAAARAWSAPAPAAPPMQFCRACIPECPAASASVPAPEPEPECEYDLELPPTAYMFADRAPWMQPAFAPEPEPECEPECELPPTAYMFADRAP